MAKLVGLPNSSTVPDFVKASNANAVRLQFAKKQIEVGGHLRPLGAPSFVKDEWYIWFLVQEKIENIGENDVT